jgi:nucleoside 2-deoxyribosyltransferase
MKIYLAARYRRREEMQGRAADLEAAGHEVTSRWIRGSHEPVRGVATAEERAVWAAEGMSDLRTADALIAFTEPPEEPKSRGGRHVEFGVALGLHKRIAVIGPQETVFHCLPRVERFDSWREFMAHLEGFAAPSRRRRRTVEVTDEQFAQLQAVARQSGLSPSQVLENLILVKEIGRLQGYLHLVKA